MPAVGAGSFRQLPSVPKPTGVTPPAVNLRTPLPVANVRTANNPRGTAIVQPVVQTPPRMLTTANNPRGTAIVQPQLPPTFNDLTAGNPDPTTTINVFRAQPLAQQRAIVRGAIQSPQTPASKIVLNYVQRVNSGPIPQIPGLASIRGASAVGAIVNATSGLPRGVLKVLGNAAKDVVNLPGGTVEGIAGELGQGFQGFSDLTSGNLSGAASHEAAGVHGFVDPYVNFAKDPVGTFLAHPVNTLMLLQGPKAALLRGGGALARAGVLGETAAKAASTVRAPLSLGTVAGEPSPIVEARDFSPDVLNKAFQVAREKVIRSRGQDPNISRPVPALPPSVAYAMNAGTRAKLYRQADEMTSVHQMAQRGERTQAIQNVQKFRPSKPAENVVTHVLQGVLRTPATAAADATAEIDRLRAVQAELPRRSLALSQNRSQIRDLTTALHTPGALNEALKAADGLRPIHNAAGGYLAEHALLDPEQALRAKLFPYAQAHMGAKYNNFRLERLENAIGSRLP